MEYKIEPVYLERFLILVVYIRRDKIQERFVKTGYDYKNEFYIEGFYPSPKDGSIFHTEEDAKEAIIEIVTSTSFKFSNGYIYKIISADTQGNLKEVKNYTKLYWYSHVIAINNPFSLDRKLSKDIPGVCATFQEVPETYLEKFQKYLDKQNELCYNT